ncbi:MAG: hypothetical protein JOZ42_01570, partial [Acetobacteraceae bacterium]|nr:hypothetical protein [Acetobacteraceae bacterium]
MSALPEVSGGAGTASPRVNGTVGSTEANLTPQISYGEAEPITVRQQGQPSGRGDITLDFADTDIREVVAQILGRILHVNYTVDPAVHGTVTLHTATPLAANQLLPVLQSLLAQNGATLVQSGGLYQVVPQGPAGPAAGAPGGAQAGGGGGPVAIASGNETAGAVVVPLRFAGAEDLVKALQAFAGTSARIVADPGRNALLISGEPAARAALVDLVRAFDIDVLAGQSYALLPVKNGDAKDFASAMQDTFRSQNGGALAGVVRVVPMERVSAVLVVASQPRYVNDARRVFALVERVRRETVRSWHVYYLQNSHANDIAYVLQRAFTPNDVTAQPSQSPGQTAPGMGTRQVGGIGAGGAGGGFGGMGGGSSLGSLSGGGLGGGLGGNGGLGGGGLGGGLGGGSGSSLGGGNNLLSQGGLGQSNAGSQNPAGANPQAAGQSNPLFGGLEEGGKGGPEQMRIIPDPQNNAVLVYATPREEDTVEAMLRKID